MSVYDKELIINGQAVRSPEQQVYKNMKDIEELKEKIKEWYSCDTELNSSSVSVARTNTNVPDEIDDGFLLDPVGNLFKITGGDEGNLLLAFYASIAGPEGPAGETGETGPAGQDGQTHGILTFSNIACETDNFVASTEYADYPYECVVINTNQVINKIVNGGCCMFDVPQANSGNYASVCDVDTTTGDIKIYSKEIPADDFTILSIWLIVQ